MSCFLSWVVGTRRFIPFCFRLFCFLKLFIEVDVHAKQYIQTVSVQQGEFPPAECTSVTSAQTKRQFGSFQRICPPIRVTLILTSDGIDCFFLF